MTKPKNNDMLRISGVEIEKLDSLHEALMNQEDDCPLKFVYFKDLDGNPLKTVGILPLPVKEGAQSLWLTSTTRVHPEEEFWDRRTGQNNVVVSLMGKIERTLRDDADDGILRAIHTKEELKKIFDKQREHNIRLSHTRIIYKALSSKMSGKTRRDFINMLNRAI